MWTTIFKGKYASDEISCCLLGGDNFVIYCLPSLTLKVKSSQPKVHFFSL